MCFITQCDKCKKLTWSGCGRHIQQIKDKVSPQERCNCKSWD